MSLCSARDPSGLQHVIVLLFIQRLHSFLSFMPKAAALSGWTVPSQILEGLGGKPEDITILSVIRWSVVQADSGLQVRITTRLSLLFVAHLLHACFFI